MSRVRRLGLLLVLAAGCRPFDEAYDAALARLDAGSQAGGRAAGGAAAGGLAGGGTAGGGSAGGASAGGAGGGSTSGGSAGGAFAGGAGGGSTSGGSAGGGTSGGTGGGGGGAAGGTSGGAGGGTAGGAAPCPTTLCIDEFVTGFGPNSNVRALSTTEDGGVLAGLFINNATNLLLWREDGGWSTRTVAGTTNRTDLRHLTAWSRELVAIADSSGPNMNLGGTASEYANPKTLCGTAESVYASAMGSPDEAWFGGNEGIACGWRRDAGFSTLDLTVATGRDLSSSGESTRFEGAWVTPEGRRFFAGSFATAVGELPDGGWVVSRLNPAMQSTPVYTAMRASWPFLLAVGQDGLVARWDEDSASWLTSTSDPNHQFQDVWVEDPGTAWAVGQVGTSTSPGSSFIARLQSDGGVTPLPLTFAPTIQLVAITGAGTAIYVGGRDRNPDGGTLGGAVLFKLSR